MSSLEMLTDHIQHTHRSQLGHVHITPSTNTDTYRSQMAHTHITPSTCNITPSTHTEHTQNTRMQMDHTQHTHTDQIQHTCIDHTQHTCRCLDRAHPNACDSTRGCTGSSHRPGRYKDLPRMCLWPDVLEAESETGICHLWFTETVLSEVPGARMWSQARPALA